MQVFYLQVPLADELNILTISKWWKACWGWKEMPKKVPN